MDQSGKKGERNCTNYIAVFKIRDVKKTETVEIGELHQLKVTTCIYYTYYFTLSSNVRDNALEDVNATVRIVI